MLLPVVSKTLTLAKMLYFIKASFCNYIKRTEQNLNKFEAQFGLSTSELIKRFENDELPETLDYVEWVGEYRLLMRLHEKTEALREIRFAN